MAAITKLTAVILVVCFIALIEAQGPPQGGQQGGQQESQRGQRGQPGGPQGGNQQKGQFRGRNENQGSQPNRQFKRSIDHQDGDGNDAIMDSAAESSYFRPSRIRFMPGYLH